VDEDSSVSETFLNKNWSMDSVQKVHNCVGIVAFIYLPFVRRARLDSPVRAAVIAKVRKGF
jgi:hypothetical protein